MNNIKQSRIFSSYVPTPGAFPCVSLPGPYNSGRRQLASPDEEIGSEEFATYQGPLISKWQSQNSTPRTSVARAQDPNHYISATFSRPSFRSYELEGRATGKWSGRINCLSSWSSTIFQSWPMSFTH